MDTDDLLHEALEKHRTGDNAGALKLYSQVLTLEPNHFNARLNLASLALDSGKPDDARKLLEVLVLEDAGSGVAHLLLARASFLLNDHDAGYRHIQQAHELLPEDEGVTGEYVNAMRRRCFTFNADEYKTLREVAMMGQLKESRWQRLAQLTLSRMIGPELIRLLTQEGLDQDTPDAVTRRQQGLPVERQNALSIMSRDLQEYVNAVKAQPRFAAQRCNVHMRAPKGQPHQEPISCDEFTDVDTLTGATLELVKLHDVEFVPFADIRSIEFGDVSTAVPAVITLAGGRETSGLVPLFYLFTDFAESERVRAGKATLFRAIIPGVVLGVGMRSFNSSRGLLPMANIERIDYIG